MNVVLISGVFLNMIVAGAALAGEACDVPVAEWRPREALQAKLEADGWVVRSIRAEDGCYEASAVDPRGSVVEAHFNPKTFDRVDTTSKGTSG